MKGPRHKTIGRISWLCLLFMLAGYVPTLFLLAPHIGMVIAVVACIPVGSRAASTRRGALWGLFYGALAGVGSWLALDQIVTKRALDLAQAGRIATSAATSMATSAATAASAPASGPATLPTTMPVGLAGELPASAAVYLIVTTAIMCAATAALFAYLSQRRRARIDEEWRT